MNKSFEQSLLLSRLLCLIISVLFYLVLSKNNLTLFISAYTTAHFSGSLIFGNKYINNGLKSFSGIFKLLIINALAILMLKISFSFFVLLLALHFALSDAYIKPTCRLKDSSNFSALTLFGFYFSSYFFILRVSVHPLLAFHSELLIIPLIFALCLVRLYSLKTHWSDLLFLIPTIASVFWKDNLGLAIFYHVTTWLFYPKFLSGFKGLSFHKNDGWNLALIAFFVGLFYSFNAFDVFGIKDLYRFSVSMFIIHAMNSFIMSELNPKLIRNYLLLA